VRVGGLAFFGAFFGVFFFEAHAIIKRPTRTWTSSGSESGGPRRKATGARCSVSSARTRYAYLVVVVCVFVLGGGGFFFKEVDVPFLPTCLNHMIACCEQAATRQFARGQMTWFRNTDRYEWVRMLIIVFVSTFKNHTCI
jgi:hypothetical protein